MTALRRFFRRPMIVWAICLILAGFTVYNVLLAVDHFRHAGRYRDLGVSYTPAARAVLALEWAAVFAVLLAGWLVRRRWVRRWTLIALCNYAAFSVLWLFVYADSAFSEGRIAFMALLAISGVALAAWVLRWRRIRETFEPQSGAQP